MKKVVRLSESDLVKLVKKVINEQQNNLVGKTVNLYKDKQQTQIYQTITISKIENRKDKTGEIIQIRVPNPEEVKLRTDNPTYNPRTAERYYPESYRKLAYKVNCVKSKEIPPIQLSYQKSSSDETIVDDYNTYASYNNSFREKIGEKLFYNDKFVRTILLMYCSSSSRTTADFASTEKPNNPSQNFV